jgi:quercetin dioxygenase-like cupin family protein
MSKKGEAFYVSKNEALEDLGGGIRRQVMVNDDHLMMVKEVFEDGAIGYVHSHPNRQVTYVASGVFEVTIDGVKKVLRKGDSFFVAPDLRHGVLCVESGVVVDVFNPVREVFVSHE